jgi:hypothetical protein
MVLELNPRFEHMPNLLAARTCQVCLLINAINLSTWENEDCLVNFTRLRAARKGCLQASEKVASTNEESHLCSGLVS